MRPSSFLAILLTTPSAPRSCSSPTRCTLSCRHPTGALHGVAALLIPLVLCVALILLLDQLAYYYATTATTATTSTTYYWYYYWYSA